MKKILNEKGQSMVEFVLILPVFLLLVIGMLDISRVLNTKFVLENVSRNAARTGAITNVDSEIVEVINNGTTFLDPSNLRYTITPVESNRSIGEDISIHLEYDISINTPLLSSVIGGIITVEGDSIMRVE